MNVTSPRSCNSRCNKLEGARGRQGGKDADSSEAVIEVASRAARESRYRILRVCSVFYELRALMSTNFRDRWKIGKGMRNGVHTLSPITKFSVSRIRRAKSRRMTVDLETPSIFRCIRTNKKETKGKRKKTSSRKKAAYVASTT